MQSGLGTCGVAAKHKHASAPEGCQRRKQVGAVLGRHALQQVAFEPLDHPAPFGQLFPSERREVQPERLPVDRHAFDQPGILQYLQMLHHGAAVDVREGIAERARGQRPVTQRIQNLPPGMVAESLEDAVVLGFV